MQAGPGSHWEDCLSAAEECNAPMVSICGGEPLIYPQIEALVEGQILLADRAYDSDTLRQSLAARGAWASNPCRTARTSRPSALSSIDIAMSL